MKTLKFEHHLARLIQEGKKTTTWRFYDDKNLVVNDVVQLIDKVEEENPATWRVFATARINEVIQKRLGDIGKDDYDGHEQFSSPQAMLETYRGYYGDAVDFNTPVKIIRFSLDNIGPGLNQPVVIMSTLLTDIKMYADGGSRGNPGPSAAGFVVVDSNDKVVVKKGIYLGVTTNNQAEYQALKLGLEEALRMGARNVDAYMDSLLVVNQMRGIFKVRNRDLWPIHAAIKELEKKFKSISYTHVPRALNKLADAAVNEALDEAAKK
jgi:ribonuclease HI